MADNYLQFSEVLPRLTAEEEVWLCRQLETVCVFGDKEYVEDELPEELYPEDADWQGCRAYRDMEDYDAEAFYGVGFGYGFEDGDGEGGPGRHLWMYAEECSSVGRVAHLVQKFLKQFRPDQYWSLTYATTCSKLRIGEFGGGAIFVTADNIQWNNAYAFVEEQQKAFERRQQHEMPLVQKAKNTGIDAEQLDEAVQEAAAQVASAINNGGIQNQIAYLVEQLGTEEVEKIVHELPGTEESPDNSKEV